MVCLPASGCPTLERPRLGQGSLLAASDPSLPSPWPWLSEDCSHSSLSTTHTTRVAPVETAPRPQSLPSPPDRCRVRLRRQAGYEGGKRGSTSLRCLIAYRERSYASKQDQAVEVGLGCLHSTHLRGLNRKGQMFQHVVWQ